jgi:hypothetical protein
MSDLPCLIAARAYRQRGWYPIPVPLGSKNPGRKGWEDLRLDLQDLGRYFANPLNVSVLLGVSDSLVDIDIDALNVLDLAERYMPPTGRIFGRPGKPASHRLYTAPGAETVKFADPTDGEMLVELRSTGCQTVFPPSTHETGELIAWEQRGEAATVAAADITSACTKLAVATLIRKHLPDREAELLSQEPAAWVAALGKIDQRLESTVSKWLGLPYRNGEYHAPPRSTRAIGEHPYIRAAIDREIETLRGTGKGSRNEQLNRCAFALAQWIESGAVSQRWIETTLIGIAREIGLVADDGEKAAADTIASGIRAGAAQPREIPADERRRHGGGRSKGASGGDGVDEQPSVRDFPTMAPEAFTGLAGEIVRMIEPHTESDSVAVLLNLHAFFGNAIGRGPHYLVEGTKHGPNFFILQIGDTAKARKGTGADRIRQLFRHVDEEWTINRLHSGLSSGEGVIWEVRDSITKLVKDGKGDTATFSEEVVDHGITDKRLMVLESEFAGALRVMQREGNILSRVLRDAWDRGDLATLTKNSPARATGACISIVAHITASELRECLDRTEMANGFANRFLFACVKRSKFLPFGGNLADAGMAGMAETVRKAVERARTIQQVRMSPEAASGWETIYRELSGDRPGLLGSLTARAEAQVVRLALIYALWEGSRQIGIEHLTAALAVWEFCSASVEYVFGDSLGDPIADAILAALKTAGPAGSTRTDLRDLFSRHVPANQIARALGELSRRGLAIALKGGSTGGRPAEAWALTGGSGQ